MSNNQNSGTEFPSKWEKILKQIPEFRDTADAASEADLKKMIIQNENHINTIEKEKDNDSKYLAAKELCKEYAAPYRDAIKNNMAKIKYCLFLLDGKGVDLDK